LGTSGGEAHEVKGYDALIELHDINPDKLLGDTGYDATIFATMESAASSP
jgi:hypothetical protein